MMRTPGGVRLFDHSKLSMARDLIKRHHYTHSVPSGKSYYMGWGDAVCVISIPANQFVGKFLFGRQREVWELSRLWAPDGHERNLLTRLISESVQIFRKHEPTAWALVSYADPNVGHSGLVYRAASWLPCGQVEESRYYRDSAGVGKNATQRDVADDKAERVDATAHDEREAGSDGY